MTKVRQSLKSFNRLAVSHSVPRSRNKTYIVRFQKCRLGHLIEIYDIAIACRKGSILTNIKNKFLNAQHAFLSA